MSQQSIRPDISGLGLDSPIRLNVPSVPIPRVSSVNQVKTPTLSVLTQIPGFVSSPSVSPPTPQRTPQKTPQFALPPIPQRPQVTAQQTPQKTLIPQQTPQRPQVTAQQILIPQRTPQRTPTPVPQRSPGMDREATPIQMAEMMEDLPLEAAGIENIHPQVPEAEKDFIPLPSIEGRRTSPMPYRKNGVSTLPIIRATQIEPLAPTMSNRTNIAENLAKMAKDDGIEQMLERNGYKILSKILVHSDDMTKARYFEAVNPRGQRVFVELNIDGIIALREGDSTLIEGRMATVIPYSSKMGAIQCTNGMCGIAFVCHDGICAIDKSESRRGEETEMTFVYSGEGNKSAKLGNNPIPYPIVLLSEIKQNPEAVLKTTDEVTRRIRSGPYRNCVKNLEEMKKDFQQAEINFDRFINAQKKAAEAINSSIDELEQIHQLYLQNPPHDDEGRRRQHQVVYNLQRRHEMALLILDSCFTVGKKREKLNKWSEMIEDVSEIIEKIADEVPYIIAD